MKFITTIILSLLSLLSYSQLIEYKEEGSKLQYNINGSTFNVGGVRYYTPNLGVDTMKFTSVQPATLDPVSITFQTLAATDTVYLDWGDGSAIVKISNVTDQIVTSSYAANNTTYNIKLYGDLSKIKKFHAFNLTVASLNINDISDYMTNLKYLYLRDIMATGNKALPTGITTLYLSGNNINWTYEGALPTDITSLVMSGTNINWTYVGALPTNITSLTLSGANIKWTYEGALPTGITYLSLSGNNINWTYTGALPNGITTLYLIGANINWTGLNIGNTGDITLLSLNNYRSEKMSSEDMVTLLTQMKNRTGSLPATITINDYADYDLQPQAVKDAVAALKAYKSITTVTLGQ